MKIRNTVLGMLICFAVSGAVARADDTSDIHTLFYRVARAMSAKDPGAVMALGTSDLTYIEKGKVLSGGQIAQHMQARFRMMQGSPRCRFNVTGIQIKGKTASAMTTEFTEAQISGTTGRMHKVISNGKSRNELVKTKNGWRLRSVYVLSSSMTMDGKNLNVSALGGGR